MDKAIFDQLVEKIGQVEQVENPVPIYTYVSTPEEIDTRKLIEYLWTKEIPVAVPKVEGSVIRFYQITSWDDLEQGCMGILEPKNNLQIETEQGLVITPGLAFDTQNNRMGYGGGYYDRFFAEHPALKRVGIAYSFQVLPEIPTDQYDIPVDTLITERKG